MHGRWDGTGRNGDGPRQFMIVGKIMVWRGPSSISGDHKTLVRSTSYLQSSKKVFGHGWENAAGKLRQKREATAGTKLTNPRTNHYFWLCTGNLYKAIHRLKECCRQVEAEEVSNSRNKTHQTTYQPLFPALYMRRANI